MQTASFILAINLVLSCVFLGRAETYGTIDSPDISGLDIVDEDFEVVYTLTKYSNNPVKIFFKSSAGIPEPLSSTMSPTHCSKSTPG